MKLPVIRSWAPSCATLLMLAVAALATFLLNAASTQAQDGGGSPTRGSWGEGTNGKPVLIINVEKSLTQKQRAMIEGGFTTVSQLTLVAPEGTSTKSSPPQDSESTATEILYTLRCSVKFDAWEETFDVARLDDTPRTAVVKTFADYGSMCLTSEIDASTALAQALASAPFLIARLSVKQTSLEEATKIKEWLVQQQSGVMQSLFSHMLGELTLSQAVDVRVAIPKRTEGERARQGSEPSVPKDEGRG